MMKNRKLAITTVLAGVAYLLRNKESRNKLKEQFQQFLNPSKKAKGQS